MNILTVNLLFSMLIFWVAARIYVLPILRTLPPQTILLPILLLHAFRHLGLMFLAPAATHPGIPPQFAYPAALGDLCAALLAVVAIPAVARGGGRLRVWIFNVEARLISSPRSSWQPSMAQRSLWPHPIGYRRSGCLLCW